MTSNISVKNKGVSGNKSIDADLDTPSSEEMSTFTADSSGLVTELESTSDEAAKLETKLNELVNDALSQGLSHFGGENVVESLLYILELEHSVDLRNIVRDLNSLQIGLDEMFGSASYVVLEHICADLARKLGLDPTGRTFEQLVEEARVRMKG
jgi:hypothetical protein